MSEYIYFITSLPYLSIERDAAMSYEQFLSQASEQLKKSDFNLLKKATFAHDEGVSGNRIIRDWDSFNFALEEYITEERAKKLGIRDTRYRARCPFNEEIRNKARRIVALPDPLEAEKAVLVEYFSFLSSHKVESQFSLDALIIYGLLLQIKEKVAGYDERKGRAEFDRLYSDIRKDISLRSNL